MKAINFTSTAVLVRAGRTIIKNMKHINGEGATTVYCQVFDASATANVTVGSTTPTWVMVSTSNGGSDDFVGELVFDNGIVVAGTTTATGSGAPPGSLQNFFAVVE